MKRASCIVLSVFIFPAYSTVLGDLAAQMSPGEFRELATTGLSQSLLNTSGQNCCNNSILQYAAKGQWDPKTEQFFFLGSPHGNPSKFIIYSAAGNSWRTGPLPESCFNNGHTSGGCNVHSYYYSSIDDKAGLFYFYHAGKKTIAEYNIAGNTWRTLSGSLNVYDASYGGLAFFPERNGFVYASGGTGSFWYSRAQNAWVSNVAYSSSTYHLFALYNPLHKIVLFGGGNGDRRIVKMDTTGKVTALASSPAPLGTNNGYINCDPVTGELLLYSSGNSFYKFDVNANQWTKLTPQIPAAFASSFDPAIGIAAAPVSNHGVVMYLTYSPAKVYLYKHSQGTKVEAKAEPKDNRAISLSPNPARNAVSIQLSSLIAGKAEIELYGASGRSLKGWRAGGTTADVSALPAGVYFIRARTPSGVFSKKLLVSR